MIENSFLYDLISKPQKISKLKFDNISKIVRTVNNILEEENLLLEFNVKEKIITLDDSLIIQIPGNAIIDKAEISIDEVEKDNLITGNVISALADEGQNNSNNDNISWENKSIIPAVRIKLFVRTYFYRFIFWIGFTSRTKQLRPWVPMTISFSRGCIAMSCTGVVGR